MEYTNFLEVGSHVEVSYTWGAAIVKGIKQRIARAVPFFFFFLELIASRNNLAVILTKSFF
jgi:hypothetical protein